jgi:hypothetical protein
MDKSAKRRRRREKIKEYVEARSKSPVAGTLYALIYGPFGCIYTNPKATFIAVLVAITLGMVYWPLIFVVWLGCVVMAPFQVRAYNAKIRRNARYVVM